MTAERIPGFALAGDMLRVLELAHSLRMGEDGAWRR